VIGQPSAKWGESVCAVVVRRDGWQGDDAALATELRALCESRLARFKQPKSFEFIDALPRNPSGKILKRHVARSVLRGGGPCARNDRGRVTRPDRNHRCGR
jgi:acyl-coenzyme A synthetase/AMP-(fatty) acid ligase